MKSRLLVFTLSMILCGCCSPFVEEPSCTGLISPKSGEEWTPPEDYTRLCMPDTIDDIHQPQLEKALSLGEMIDIALQNNPITRTTWSQARAAAFNYGASQSLNYPVITLDESFEFNDVKIVPRNPALISGGAAANNGIAGSSLGHDYFENLDSNLIISWLLMDFGGRSATIESAKQALYASNWTYNQSILDVILSVLQAYYVYLENVASVTATEKNLKDATTSLDAAENLFQAGLVTKVDVLQAKSTLANVQLTLENFKGQVKIALGQLATALGLPANTPLNVADTPETIPIEEIEGDLDKLMEIAREKRPDLAEKQAVFMQKKADYITAYSASLPTLSAFSNLDRRDYWQSPLLRSHNYSSGFTVSIPIFQGFFYEYNMRRAQADIDTAYADWQEQEEIVLNNVLSSYYALQTTVESLKFSEEFLVYSQEAYDATLAGYKAGTNTFVDILAAEAALANARSQLIQNRAKWAQALSSLAYSIGVLGSRTEPMSESPLFQKLKSEEEKVGHEEAIPQ